MRLLIADRQKLKIIVTITFSNIMCVNNFGTEKIVKKKYGTAVKFVTLKIKSANFRILTSVFIFAAWHSAAVGSNAGSVQILKFYLATI